MKSLEAAEFRSVFPQHGLKHRIDSLRELAPVDSRMPAIDKRCFREKAQYNKESFPPTKK